MRRFNLADISAWKENNLLQLNQRKLKRDNSQNRTSINNSNNNGVGGNSYLETPVAYFSKFTWIVMFIF